MLIFFHSMKLKTKIAVSTIILVISSTFLTAWLFYRYFSNQLEYEAFKTSSSTAALSRNLVDEKLKGLLKRVYSIRLNTTFTTNISNVLLENESYHYSLALTYFSNMFSEFRSSEELISSVYMHTPKGNFFDMTKMRNFDFDFKKTDLYNQLVKSTPALVYWTNRSKDEIYLSDDTVVPITFRFSVEGYNEDNFLVLNLDSKKLLKYLESNNMDSSTYTLIIDKNGKTITSNWDEQATSNLINNSEFLQKLSSSENGNFEFGFSADSYIVSYHSSVVAPWTIIKIISKSILMEKLKKIRLYIAMFAIISTAVCLILALIISNSITKPLTRLGKTMKKVTDKNFSIRFDYPYDNEVGQLATSFNFMVIEIRKLVDNLNSHIDQLRDEKDKVKLEQALKRQAELRALQSQINPHFLYNTLDSVNWLAKNINATEISKIITSLGNLFRISLSKGQEIIAIKDEISHISNYLSIQKLRYNKKFDYKIDIEESILDRMTVKLILQPLVENALYHGIKAKDTPGLIAVTARQVENEIEFIVWDDGVGINLTRLDLINKILSEGGVIEQEGYGIYNVNERIKLHFGDKYGLVYDSRPGEGTLAKILIPVLNRWDVNKNV